MEFSLLTFQTKILGLLLVACLSAIALRRLHFPYTVGLVVIGLLLGFLGDRIPGIEALTSLNLSHDAILFIFLPPLIFESALTLNARLLLRNITPVLVLATVGLLLATGIVAALMAWLTPLSWHEALLFGALISATDPVAVIALFKELGVPDQLVVLVEGESLFNDATAIVTFNLILAAAAMSTDSLSANSLVLEGLGLFFRAFFGGLAVGAVFAGIMSYWLIAAHRNPFIQGTLSGILAFATFIIAEHSLHVSGVMAVLSAGMVTSWMVAVQLKPTARQFLHELWEYLSFLTNSLIFLLVGLASAQILAEVNEMVPLFSALAIAIAAVLFSRAVVIFTLIPIINRIHAAPAVSFAEQAVLSWGGLRGAVGLALALSLENEMVDGRFLVALTLGVALFTLLVPGTTMGALLNRLNLNKSSVTDQLETAEAMITADRKALAALANLQLEGEQYQTEIEQISGQIEQSLAEAQAQLATVWDDMQTDATQRKRAIWLQALAIEQQGYHHLHDHGILSAAAFMRANLGISARKSEVVANRLPPPPLRTRLLMTRIEFRATRLLKRLLPRKWRDRTDLQQFAVLYQCDLAIAQVTRQVIQRLMSLPRHCQKEQTFDRCLAYYQACHDSAQRRILRSAEKYPAAAHQFEQRIAQQVAAAGREDAIEMLLDDGVISDAIAQRVCHQFALK
ncbi:MAG: cation:proton antiporter [Cyanobacteria bacterium P01_D01_bin.105]